MHIRNPAFVFSGLAAVGIAAFILREVGVFSIKAYQMQREVTLRTTPAHRAFNVTSIRYSPSDGQLQQYSQEPYAATVSYSVQEELSPWRWVPLYKSGSNEARLVYLIWVENHLMGCGSVHARGSQTITGIASARDYADAFTLPLIDQMKRDAAEKLNVFQRSN